MKINTDLYLNIIGGDDEHFDSKSVAFEKQGDLNRSRPRISEVDLSDVEQLSTSAIGLQGFSFELNDIFSREGRYIRGLDFGTSRKGRIGSDNKLSVRWRGDVRASDTVVQSETNISLYPVVLGLGETGLVSDVKQVSEEICFSADIFSCADRDLPEQVRNVRSFSMN